MNLLPLQRVLAASLREMCDDARNKPAGAEHTINVAGGYGCALYIDLKTAGHTIRFSKETLARCGGVPSDPQFFRDLGALDELLGQVDKELSESR